MNDIRTDKYFLLYGDCLARLKELPDNSVDAIVTDPPYGINFMSKKWDYQIPSVDVWTEAMRVLKPGGHMLCACGTRTNHRMVCNIEDAGFQIFNSVCWLYGSGFPKSQNISKMIDKASGVFGPAVGSLTVEAKQWEGWQTALKPAFEFFTLARKPLSEKTVAANVMKWGTGGINVDGCRVEVGKNDGQNFRVANGQSNGGNWGSQGAIGKPQISEQNAQGRFPANLIHDGSPEVVDGFPVTGKSSGGVHTSGHDGEMRMGCTSGDGTNAGGLGDQGSAARFFYCAKASKKDRNEGLEGMPAAVLARSNMAQADAVRGNTVESGAGGFNKARIVKNNHPTVKPTELMQYLCRLITPPGGTVLDPYMGSGSTGKAAALEGFKFTGIELDADYFDIATRRIKHANHKLF